MSIKECTSCGFAFGAPFVGGTEVFYRILHEQMGYPSWRWDYEVALRHSRVRRMQSGRALDIGAGIGVFLSSLSDGWEKHAIESTAITRGVIAGKGIAAYANIHAPELQRLTQSFDLITMFQVLEHVSDFYPLLRDCHALLKPGGLLVITVPDGKAMAEQEAITGCPDMPPNHISRWTPNSLALALRRSRFAPEAAIAEPAAWSKIGQNLYLKVLADASRRGSLAARIYRIRRRAVRAPLLGAAGVIGGLGLIKYATRLRQGGAFAMAATREDWDSELKVRAT